MWSQPPSLHWLHHYIGYQLGSQGSQVVPCNGVSNVSLHYMVVSVIRARVTKKKERKTWTRKDIEYKMLVSLRPRTNILYTISLGFMFHGFFFLVSYLSRAQKNEPQETKYCMPNLLYTCNVRRGMQYWFLVGSYLRARENQKGTVNM